MLKYTERKRIKAPGFDENLGIFYLIRNRQKKWKLSESNRLYAPVISRQHCTYNEHL